MNMVQNIDSDLARCTESLCKMSFISPFQCSFKIFFLFTQIDLPLIIVRKTVSTCIVEQTISIGSLPMQKPSNSLAIHVVVSVSEFEI